MTSGGGGDTQIDRLRKMSKCVYLACEKPVADDLAAGLLAAVDRIEALERHLAASRAEAERLRVIAKDIMARKGSYDCPVDPRVQMEYERAYRVIQGLSDGTNIYTDDQFDAALTQRGDGKEK